jgi:hypothetical protein
MANDHKVLIVFAERGKRNYGVAPLEFDERNRPFVVYETYHTKGESEAIGKDRIPLNPLFLERLARPRDGADY